SYYILTEMMNMRWDGAVGEPLTDHITCIRSLGSQLRSMIKSIDDEFTAFLLLHSLPNEDLWSTLCTSILNSIPANSKLTFADVETHITLQATSMSAGKAAKVKVKTQISESDSDSDTANSVHISCELSDRILLYTASRKKKSCKHIISNSGASAHMCPHITWFDPATFHALDPPRRVSFGDESYVLATGIGEV
ncbi:hypothetical protein FISHEDRAFT_22001, partial [Fistulina hepatica ATCC 64428]